MQKILITGGLGFVGGRLAKALSKENNVIVSSRKAIGADQLAMHGPVSQVLHADILQKETFPLQISTVIHLAALNEWDCVSHPSEAIRVNIDETRIILENSIAAGAKQFIYFSTAHVYASPLKGKIDETMLPVPVHPYAITHKAAEDYVVAAALQKKIKGIIIRLSNSFGAPVLPTVNRWTLLANDLCRQAIEKKKLVLLSNGCQYRDFVCLADVENILRTIIEANPERFNKIIYNLGAGSSMRVIDMANMIATCYQELFGEAIPVQLPDGAVATNEPALHFSVERLLSEGCAIGNSVTAELKGLLLFCSKYFRSND